MFGKKLLSIVGLIFLGSQIISVEADCSVSVFVTAGICTPYGCKGTEFFKMEEGGKVYIFEVVSGGKSCSISKNKNFCEKSGNIMIMVDSFCSDTVCDKTYDCDDNGVCKEDKNPRSCQNVSCKWNAESETFEGCEAGDYLIVEETKDEHPVVVGLIEESMKDSVNNNAKLYSCSEHSEEPPSKRDNVVSCEAVKGNIAVGYYKNAGSVNSPYIQCDDIKGCSPVAPQKGSCSEAIIGDLFIDDEVVKICLDDGIPLALEGNKDVVGKYFMKTKVVDLNVFKGYFEGVSDVSNSYVALDVQAKEIHLSTKGQHISMYRFTNENHKIFEKENSDKICQNGNKIVEFKLNSCSASDVEYYSKSGEQLYNVQQQADPQY